MWRPDGLHKGAHYHEDIPPASVATVGAPGPEKAGLRQRTFNVVGDQLLRWAHALVDAVDHDNSIPPTMCRQTRTLPVLEAAPMPVRQQTSFGTLRVASRPFAPSSAAVLFPEQLSVRRRSPKRAFGAVFVDKLADLFLRRVAPLVGSEPDDLNCSDPDMVRRLRRIAFLAHEWGHVTDAAVAQTVLARRLAAVIGELHADLGAIVMLLATCRRGLRLRRPGARAVLPSPAWLAARWRQLRSRSRRAGRRSSCREQPTQPDCMIGEHLIHQRIDVMCRTPGRCVSSRVSARASQEADDH
jgi:predicted nucleic acid-binding protein